MQPHRLGFRAQQKLLYASRRQHHENRQSFPAPASPIRSSANCPQARVKLVQTSSCSVKSTQQRQTDTFAQASEKVDNEEDKDESKKELIPKGIIDIGLNPKTHIQESPNASSRHTSDGRPKGIAFPPQPSQPIVELTSSVVVWAAIKKDDKLTEGH